MRPFSVQKYGYIELRWLEQPPHKRKVAGSSPAVSRKKNDRLEGGEPDGER